MSVCQRDNSRTVWDIITKVLWEKGMIKSSDEFENGCISMHFCDVLDSFVNRNANLNKMQTQLNSLQNFT